MAPTPLLVVQVVTGAGLWPILGLPADRSPLASSRSRSSSERGRP
ncbi:MAG TPA: hypothetical protein VMV23_05985 [Candidatus Nanopelagicaceae bacterium]|nr:hypothetical protein [Candidatus Nanopelagicaceae bacterium]